MSHHNNNGFDWGWWIASNQQRAMWQNQANADRAHAENLKTNQLLEQIRRNGLTQAQRDQEDAIRMLEARKKQIREAQEREQLNRLVMVVAGLAAGIFCSVTFFQWVQGLLALAPH